MAHRLKQLGISLLLPLGAGVLGATVTYPALPHWYAGLTKPVFVPPGWVFGAVWTVLYVLMGLSLYLVWTAANRRPKRTVFVLFGTQLLLNVAWSVTFFGMHLPYVAVGVIIGLLAAVVALTVVSWRISRWAAYLLIPYVLWVGFAMVLVTSIAILNPRPDGVNSYGQCVNSSGSTILETYPPICMMRDGQRFTGGGPQATESTLVISQWSLKIPLTSGIADASYSYDANQQQILLTTTRLSQLQKQLAGCPSGLHGLYYKHEGRALIEQHPIEILCYPASTDITAQIQQIQTQLRAAAEHAYSSD
jgi:tryptophan-rich sensory protein